MKININSIYSFHQLGERENQEDSRFPDSDRPDTETAVFAVCDGVGGAAKGEVASSTVCASIKRSAASHRLNGAMTQEDFRNILTQAYKALDEASGDSCRGMGTTLTFLAFHSEGALAAHIGDSRIYQFRPGEGILYRSEDHSLVNALLRSGNISPDQVKTHPKRNVITRCMTASDGERERDEASVINLRDIREGDYFLLCSDGVTKMFEDEELIRLYSSGKSDREIYELLASRSAESDDNNTAIQIHVGKVESAPGERPDEEDEPESEETFVDTQRFERRYETVRDISPHSGASKSKLKSFFKRIFK